MRRRRGGGGGGVGVGVCLSVVAVLFGLHVFSSLSVVTAHTTDQRLSALTPEQLDLFTALSPESSGLRWLHTGDEVDTVLAGDDSSTPESLLELSTSHRTRQSRGRVHNQHSLSPPSVSSSSSSSRPTRICSADTNSHLACQTATHFVAEPRFASLRRSLESCAPSAAHHVGANSLGPPVHVDLGSGRVATVRVPCAGDSQLSAADSELVKQAASQLMEDHPGAKCGCVVQATFSPPKLKCQCTGSPSQHRSSSGGGGAHAPVPVPTVGYSGPNSDLQSREAHLDASLEQFHRRQLSAVPVADGQTSVTSQGIYADHAAIATVQQYSTNPAESLEVLLAPALASPQQQTTPASPSTGSSSGSGRSSSGAGAAPGLRGASSSSSSSSPTAELRQAAVGLPSAVDESTRVAVSAIQTALPRLQRPTDRRLWLVSEVAGVVKVLHQYGHLLQKTSSVSPTGTSPDHVHEPSDPVEARIFGASRKDLERLRRDLALGSTRISTLVTSEALDAATRAAVAPSMRTRAGVGSAMCALFPRCLSLLGGTSLQQWVLTALQQHASHAIPSPGLCADTGTEAAAAAAAVAGDDTPSSSSSSSTTKSSSKSSTSNGGAPSASSEGAASGGDLLSGLSGTGDWGLDSLLAVRRWCASPYPALWLNYASVSLSKQLPGGGTSFLQTSSSSSSSSSSRAGGDPVTVHESDLRDQLHTLAHQAMAAGDDGAAHITIREASPDDVGPGPSFAPPPGVALTPETVRSLLVRLEGTFSCLCLNAGVPAVGLGGSASQQRANDTEALRTIKGFASVAGHTIHLPPVSDEQVRDWVRRRLKESGGEDAAEVARLKAMYETLQKGASAGEVSGLVQQFRSETQQLTAERKRLEELLAARLRKLHSHLKKQADALKDAVKRSSMALVAAQKNREATVASARKHRAADLEQITKVRRLVREMGGVKTATANVQGCEGGGGTQGATLAENHAAALVALAKAQVDLDKADSGSDKAAANRRKHYEAEVRTKYMTALTAAVAYEAATQKCVTQRNGEDAEAAKAEEGSAWDKAKADKLLDKKGKLPVPKDSMSPLDLVVKGDLSGALDAAKSAEKRLSAAKAALEQERRRWEEAVVRLARPKTCLQLLSLATEGSDGIYTVFPPDDVQYRGVQVYCDMTTDGGGWTLVGYGEESMLGSPLGVSHGSFTPGSARRGSANVNSLWIVQASSEVALSWSMAGDKPKPAPNATIESYDHAVKYSIPAPATTTLAVLPAPPPQACGGSSSDWSSVKTTCIVGKCGLPAKMYAATDSLGVCRGHAYGLVVPGQPSKECDGHLPTSDDDSTTRGAVKAGIMFAVDETEGCKGLLKEGSKQRVVPAHMGVWMR